MLKWLARQRQQLHGFYRDGFGRAFGMTALAFAVVIGLIAFLILQLVFGMHLRRALVLGLVSFNLLGVGNELFQDWMGGDPLGVFDADAWKDIGANAAGSILLLALLWRRTSTSALV